MTENNDPPGANSSVTVGPIYLDTASQASPVGRAELDGFLTEPRHRGDVGLVP